jgi:hypothetical protein
MKLSVKHLDQHWMLTAVGVQQWWLELTSVPFKGKISMI